MASTVNRRIPLAQPDIGTRERELVAQVLDSDVLALGPFAQRFEQGVADAVGRRIGVSCNSGTAGLHMAVRALGLDEGAEVITTPFSFVASVNCLLYERVRVRFVDIEEDALGLDPAQVAALAGPDTRAILPVHVFGRPCRIAELTAIAKERDWRVIEDACEALGSSLDGVPMGSFGDVSVFAFYPNKQITTGEGGVAVTDDDTIASIMRSLRNQGRDEDGTWLRHIRLGYNYRLDELSAAVGVAQLERRAESRRPAAHGSTRVRGSPRPTGRGSRCPGRDRANRSTGSCTSSAWTPRIDRDAVIADLAADGVPSRPYFSPLHTQPFIEQSLGTRQGDFPVTERVAATTLALPWSSRLSEGEVQQVASALSAAVDRQARSRGSR